MTSEEAKGNLRHAIRWNDMPKKEALDVAIKALETLEEFEKAQIITGGRLNGRTYAYKCGLEDGKRKALEEEPCEDEYIKVPKKALKYRTAGMVAYNAEWLKNHFDIERAVICGVQQLCDDAISRQWLMECVNEGWIKFDTEKDKNIFIHLIRDIAPPVTPQQKMGRWIAYEVRLPDRTILNYRCSVCGRKLIGYNTETLSEVPFCHCGAKMQEVEDE